MFRRSKIDTHSPREPRGVQSVEVAARLLKALSESNGPATLSALARTADLSPSRAHSYLVSLTRAGLLKQDPSTSRYEFGALARTMGLAAIQRMDRFGLVDDAIGGLLRETGLTVAVAVWNDQGPVIVRWQRGIDPLPVNVTIGSTVPVLTTALGRVFLAYLPAEMSQSAVARELAGLKSHPVGYGLTSRADVLALATATRLDGVARIDGTLLPDLSAVAAPVWDREGQLEMAVSLIGRNNISRVSVDKSPVRELLAFASTVSDGQPG
ncbi:MAG: IclR family transcriptional regulator [Proteobacteria bacterium]|nr:IclR family transcriptional regulator [Pseudomonadota bacterium]